MRKYSLFILLVLFSVAINAQVEINGINYNLDSDAKTAEVVKGNYQGDIVIPEKIDYNDITYNVTSIGRSAFYRCYLNSIVISGSIVNIGEYAFLDCSSLTSISVESGNTVYDSRDNCNAIICTATNELIVGCQNTIIPNTVTSIGESAFHECIYMSSIIIPKSVTSIGILSFLGCKGLTSIIVESGNTVYDSRDNCNAIICTSTNELVLGCRNSVIPNTVESIGYGAFYNCDDLTSIEIPNSVITIGADAFCNCYNLTSVTIPNSVSEIKGAAFESCSSLSSIIIPNSVTEIGGWVFKYCSALTSVTIGSGVKKLYDETFQGCSSLTSVTVCQALPLNIVNNTFDEETFQTATLYVPTGRSVFFQENSIWGKFSSIVEKDMADIYVSSSPFDNLYSKRLVISYTNRDDGGGSWGGTPDDDIVQAIMFPAERMQRIKGNQITHIRFKMWHANLYNMKVWIGTSKEKRDILTQDVTNFQEGWTEIALEHPYTITGEPIFVGVDCHDLEMTYPVKWDAYSGNDTECYFFREGKWMTSKGTWYIQCMVEGENIPEKDIQLLELAGPLYKRAIKIGENYECTLKLRNWGSIPIDQYEMQALADGKEVKCSLKYDFPISRGGGVQEIYLLVTPDESVNVGSYKLSIKPKTLNGEAYDYPNEPKELTMKVYEHDIGRQKVLLQVYTGTWCGYCPGFDEIVEQKMKERNDLVLLSVHVDDKFSCQVGDSYSSLLYTNGVPDVDLNRCIWQTPYNFRETVVNYYLDDAKAQPSFANVNISGLYNEKDRMVDISICGACNEDFDAVEGWTNLTVLLVEDNVIANQYGSGGGAAYPHNGVIRTNVSAIWGDLVEWSGDKYEMNYSVKLDNDWNKDNMRVVAFLSKPFTGDNYDEINVVNCDELSLKNLSTGIQEMGLDASASDIYDLNGRKIRSKATSLEGLPKGIYIKNGKKLIK